MNVHLQREDVLDGIEASSSHNIHTDRGRLLVSGLCGAFITVYFVLTARALDPFQMHNDLGIQYHLAQLTSRGAIPLIDFEHGWNTLSWYISAGIYGIADGNATLWVFLWGRGGFILAGFAMLVIAWRAALPARWVAGMTAVWIVLTHVPHIKYAVPTVWAAIILGVDAGPSLGRRRAIRVGMAATVFWAHVELAVLLAIGTAMFDVLGARNGSWASRITTALHAPLGVLLGLGSQVGVYALLGLSPGAFLAQAIAAWTTTEFGPLFDYPFLAPSTIRMAILPAALLLPFIPLVWSRLQDPARLLAMATVALSLIAIRRPGDGHTAVAGTLIAPMLVLGVRDVSERWDGLIQQVTALRERPAVSLLGMLGGALWFAGGLQAGFRISSLVAIVALTTLCLLAVLAGRVTDLTAASLGAIAASCVVLLIGVATHMVQEVERDESLVETAALAAAVGPALDDCTGGDPEVWVVPSPLTLYDTLELRNPTPLYAFWYNLEDEHGRIRAWFADGTITTILQVGPWPESMRPLVPEIENLFIPCARVQTEGSPRQVTVWRAGVR